MGNFNTTTVMLLDEDIQLKQSNTRILMQEDIENALLSAKDEEGELCFYIDLDTPSYLDGDISEDSCYQVALMENDIVFACEYGNRTIGDLNYEQLHTVYEALKYEGYFNETEE